MAWDLDGLRGLVETGVNVYQQDRANENDVDLASLNLQTKLVEQRLAGLEPALDENPNASPTGSASELLADNKILLLVSALVGGLVLLKVAKII